VQEYDSRFLVWESHHYLMKIPRPVAAANAAYPNFRFLDRQLPLMVVLQVNQLVVVLRVVGDLSQPLAYKLHAAFDK